MSTLDGYDAIGHPIPATRLSAAYRAVKDMIPDISTEHAMALVGRVADALERDEPYEALREATHAPIGRDVHSPVASVVPTTPVALDVTGGYRLLALLLTGTVA